MSNDANHIHAPTVTDRPSAPPRPPSNSSEAPSDSALYAPCVLSWLSRGPLRTFLPLANDLAANPALRRYLKFGLVGGSGVVVDMAILFLLADPRTLHRNLALSKTIAPEVATSNNLAWSDLWTFRDRSAPRPPVRPRMLRFSRFSLICLAGTVLNVLLLSVAVSLGQLDLYPANRVVTLVVSLWSVALNLELGWRHAGERGGRWAGPVRPMRQRPGEGGDPHREARG